MKKEKSSTFYDTCWKVLASGIQYVGGYFGISAIGCNLVELYSNSKRANIEQIINGPYTSTAAFGALFFIVGSLIKDTIRQNETRSNNEDIEEIINSGLETHRNRMNKTLEDQRSYVMAYAKALENAIKRLNDGNASGLERDIRELESGHNKLINSPSL